MGKILGVLKDMGNKQEKTIWILKTLDGKEVAAYQVPFPKGIIFRKYHIDLLNDGRCLFGIHAEYEDKSEFFDIGLYDKQGELLWDTSFQADAPEVEWIPYGKALAIKAGSSFKVFGLWSFDQ